MSGSSRANGLGVCLLLAALGCGQSSPAPDRERRQEVRIPEAPARDPSEISIAELRRRLGANDNAEFHKASGKIFSVKLFQAGVTDISPLQGLPLRQLDLGGIPVESIDLLEGMPLEQLILEDTRVSDLSVVKGMPLQLLHLQNTSVSDLTPISGMRLRELNLMNTPVDSIEVLAGMPLRMLWLVGTQVKDLTPLADTPLESLDIQDTPVSDLEVLRNKSTLRRLNIAGSQVSDLTVLNGLQLQRLIWKPADIKSGLEIVRSMTSLQELGTTFENRQPPAEFWAKYDAGEFQEETASARTAPPAAPQTP